MSDFIKLPDGSAFGVFYIKRERFIKRWVHKLFSCPTFWRIKPSFTCPRCANTYRCYWDGNDVAGHGTDYCDACAEWLKAQT